MKNLILRVLAGIILMAFSFLGYDAVANAANTTDTGTASNFFPKIKDSELYYKGIFKFFPTHIEKDVKLNIHELADLKYGKLYELKLDPVEGVPAERLSLGYFYVQKDKIYKDKIYKINPVEPTESVIVCSDEEIRDTLGKDQKGFHHYLEVNGDKREYHSYSNLVETGYYESFTWEKGKGLIFYQSGFGAERDSIKLQLITDE